MRYKYAQIAAEADVSISTVSLALRGLGGPSQATRRRVFDAAQRIGYFPAILNPKAQIVLQADRRGEELLEALRVDPFYALVFAGIEARSRVVRLRLGVERSPRDVGPYGVIFVGHGVEDRDRLLCADAPVVLVNDGDARFDHVVTQNEAGAEMAVAHLLGRVTGGRGVAVVAGPGNHDSYGLRLRGATSALAARGMLDPGMVFSLPSGGCRSAYAAQAGRDSAHWLRERLDSIGGVFVYNDIAALALLDELSRCGVRVPHDLKVVGFEDTVGAADALVPVSTVRVDHKSMGAWAVDLLLLRLMEPARPPVGVTVGVSLVPRLSSAATA